MTYKLFEFKPHRKNLEAIENTIVHASSFTTGKFHDNLGRILETRIISSKDSKRILLKLGYQPTGKLIIEDMIYNCQVLSVPDSWLKEIEIPQGI